MSDYVLWISNSKFTGGVIVEKFEDGLDMIRETLPMLRKFRGSDPKTFKDWVLKVWPETVFEVRPSPTQGVEDERPLYLL